MDSAVDQKASEIEDIELQIERMQSEQDLIHEELKADKMLKDAENVYDNMKAQYEKEIVEQMNALSSAISTCIAYKESVEHHLATFEKTIRGYQHAL